jgi:hypothetical protein
MPSILRVAAAALLGLGFARAASAQASAYVPLDDPRLPLLEHLIARGDIADPSPMVRPFRRIDVARALAAADTAVPVGRGDAIHQVRLSLEEAPETDRWLVEGRAGGQAYTRTRRDLLHPAGPRQVQPYGDLRLEAVVGPIVLVSRPAGEPRLIDDPDWPRRNSNLKFTGRMAEAYVSAQFRWGSLFFGQMDRNWGPVGSPGIGLSNYAYPRTDIGFEIGTRDIRLNAVAAGLTDERATATAANPAGDIVHRYSFAHRLGVRASDRLRLALWETTVLAGTDQNFDARFRNPVSLLLLANQYGLGDQTANVMIGLDAEWRAFRHTTFQAQLGIDDFQYDTPADSARIPDRYAFTLSAFGPFGGRLGWRAFYTQNSTLAFRSQAPFESLTDAGVGLGRNFPDMDQLTLIVTVPVWGRWLLSPEATVLRQGEGRITQPVPPRAEAGLLPQVLSGTVERTYRLGLGISGRSGPLDLLADAGLHHIVNQGNVPSQTATRFEGRIQATLGLRRMGGLK